VLKAYDELIMPIDIEKIPDFVEVVLKRAARTILKEALDAFFADDKHAEVGGGGGGGLVVNPSPVAPSPVAPSPSSPPPVSPSPPAGNTSPSFPPPPGFGG